MICKRNKDNHYFNYEFNDNDCVEIWNPFRSSETTVVPYERWLTEFTIIDKWQSIKYP